MKTTIDIADDLLVKAKEMARKDKTTLKALIEDALRHMFQNRARRRRPQTVKPVIVDGQTPPEVFDNLNEIIRATNERRDITGDRG